LEEESEDERGHNQIEYFNTYNDNDGDQGYTEDESFHKEQHFLHFGDFKDDRAIFKNPVENSQYNLIERPTYLLSFNQNQYHLEENFRYSLLKDDLWPRKYLFLACLMLLNKLALAFYILQAKSEGSSSLDMQSTDRTYVVSIYLYIAVVVLLEALIVWRLKRVNVQRT
jgi:hypothetical protein